MTFDESFDEIELKRNDFKSDEHEELATELVKEWPVNFTDIGLLNDVNWREYRKVYELYTGPPETTLTVNEIREAFDTFEQFEEVRESGLMELFEDKAFSGRIDEWKDAFQTGYETGYEAGWDAALEIE